MYRSSSTTGDTKPLLMQQFTIKVNFNIHVTNYKLIRPTKVENVDQRGASLYEIDPPCGTPAHYCCSLLFCSVSVGQISFGRKGAPANLL